MRTVDELNKELTPLLGRSLNSTEQLAISQGIVPPSLLLAIVRAITARIEQKEAS